jgi:hypothetical protein
MRRTLCCKQILKLNIHLFMDGRSIYAPHRPILNEETCVGESFFSTVRRRELGAARRAWRS